MAKKEELFARTDNWDAKELCSTGLVHGYGRFVVKPAVLIWFNIQSANYEYIVLV